ncbi:MAG: hypothetical protein ACM31C_27590 [Acidobacteriota bacterium]
MGKHDVREVIARARERERIARDRTLPLAQRLAAHGYATLRFDPTRASVARAEVIAALREAATPTPAYPGRPPEPNEPAPPAPPPGPQMYLLTTPDHVQGGEGCTAPLPPNTVGLAGQRVGVDDGIAHAAPPNGDVARVSFTFDPPAPGIAYVSAVVRITGHAMVGAQGSADGPPDVHFSLAVQCDAYQIDRGYSSLAVYDTTFEIPMLSPGEGFGEWPMWSDAAFTTPSFAISVEPSSATVAPVAIAAGVGISMRANGNGNAVSWDFCPGIYVPLVVVDYAPYSSFVIT